MNHRRSNPRRGWGYGAVQALATIALIFCPPPFFSGAMEVFFAAAQEFEMTEQQFNSWVTSRGCTPQEKAQGDLDRQMKLLDVDCQLTDDQRAKLELAASVDIGRFLDRVEAMRVKVVGKKYDQNQIGEIYQEIAPLQQELQRGVVGDGSLFDKVKRSALEANQRDQLDRAEYSRAMTQYRTEVKQFIVALDRMLALTERQRQGLYDVLTTETAPPSQFGQYNAYYILNQASKIDADRWENLLDDAQRKQFDPGRRQGMANDQLLEQQGITPLQEPAGRQKEVDDVE
jgi:hypothetical protein